MTDARFTPPLSLDDPRVSEWLDGRLAAAEAAEIARLVAASPELTRVIADLRRQKAALAALPASPPPAGFVQDVLAALDAARDTADDDVEVEAEWRRIERERLEEEIAEAREDAAEPVDEPMRHRWPWLALAGALAAGVLAAIVINRPGGLVDREVALVEGQRADGGPHEQQKRGPGAPAPREEVADKWLAEADAWDKRKAESEKEGLATSLAKSAANGEPSAKRASMPNAEAAKDAAPQARAELQENAGVPPARALAAEAGPAAPAAAVPAAPLEKARQGMDVRTLTYRVRGAADRKRLEDLLAAGPGENLRARRLAADESVPRAAVSNRGNLARNAEDRARAKADGPPGERIVISGPPGMIADLVAALEAGPEAGSSADRAALAARVPRDPLAADGEAEAADAVVLVIEIVDDSGAGSEEAQP